MSTLPLHAVVADFIAAPQRMRIGGKQIESDQSLSVVNPSTGGAFTQVACGGGHEIDQAVTAAQEAFDTGPWGRMSAHDRCRILWTFAELIEEHSDIFAQLDALDNGNRCRGQRGCALVRAAF